MNYGLELYIENNGKEIKFKDLPRNAQLAVLEKFQDEMELDVEDDDVFGYVEIPVKYFADKIAGCGLFGFDFQSYHEWYMDGDDISLYNDEWAVVLENSDVANSVILDGWHRFHVYVEKGFKKIPSVIKL